MKFFIPTLAFSVVLFSSCASIVSKSSWPVSIQSNPSNLEFAVKKEDGTVVTTGKTPQIVTLDSKGGYFKAAKYTIESKKSGKVVSTTHLTAALNGWYFGNIIFGGPIGLLIVDPVTGAMYKFPETVEIHGVSMAANNTPHSLNIVSIDTLTEDQKKQLVRL